MNDLCLGEGQRRFRARDRTRPVQEGGKVNSGQLHMEDGKLVDDIRVVPNGKKTSRLVRVDAMTGEIVKDKQYGGVKGVVKKHAAHGTEEKSQKAPADSTKKP